MKLRKNMLLLVHSSSIEAKALSIQSLLWLPLEVTISVRAVVEWKIMLELRIASCSTSESFLILVQVLDGIAIAKT